MAPNPYTPSSSRLFYGREGVMRRLLANEQQGQSTILLGGRRCGKTRTLQRIRDYLAALAAGANSVQAWHAAVPDAAEDRAAPPSWTPVHWPVLVNFQGLAVRDMKDALSALADAIVDSRPPTASPLPDPPQGTGDWGVPELEEWLVKVDRQLAIAGLGGFALLVDEIGTLFSSAWSHDLMQFLRRLDDFTFRTRIWLLLAGSDDLDRFRHNDGSHPLNTSTRERLLDLDYASRRRMQIEPFTANDRLPPGDAAQVAVDRLAGGNVWLLTVLLGSAFDEGLEPDGVEATRAKVLDDHAELFQRWWDSIGAKGQEVYGVVARAGQVTEKALNRPGYRAGRLSLEHHGLLHRPAAGFIEFGPELFRDWAESEGYLQAPFAERPGTPATNGPSPPGRYRYDVALSFAGPQRELARQLADECRGVGFRVFFDREWQHEMWGADLGTFLPRTYDRDAQVAVLLVSRDYAERAWPQVEAAAALAKAAREGWGAVLLAMIDPAIRLAGYPEDVVRLDLSRPDDAPRVALELVKRLRGRQS